MSSAQLGAVLRHIRKLATARHDHEVPDRELVERFAVHQDEGAFAALLKRHGPMVLGVCQSVLHNLQDAEDAFQAAFLLLAKKAGSIHRREAVSGWLYRVAYHLALRAQADAARRKVHERRAVTMPSADPVLDLSLREVRVILFEELEKLPEQYRAPLVLCGLEEKSREEAARLLGCSSNAVKGKLERGRELLRVRLRRRGLEIPAGLFVTALSTSCASAQVSAPLAASTLKAALWLAAGKEPVAGVISAKVAGLVQGVSKTMFISKFKVATALLLAFGVGATGLGMLGHQVFAAKQPNTKQSEAPKQKPREQTRLAAPATKQEAADSVFVRGRVLDPDGKPLAGAKLYLSSSNSKETSVPVRATSGDDGHFEFTFAKSELEKIDSENRRYQVLASAKGYGCAWAPVGKAGEKLSLRLVKDMPASGRIIDADGRPVAGARLKVEGVTALTGDKREGFVSVYTLPFSDYVSNLAKGWAGSLPEQPAVLTTAADGRFRLTGVGRDRVVFLHLDGPGIATVDLGLVAGTAADHLATVSRPIRGVVRDKDTGKPLAGVTVFLDFWINPRYEESRWVKAVSDKDGRYELLGLAKSANYELMAKPPKGQLYFQRHVVLKDTPGLDAITADIEMVQGLTVRGKVTDKATGKPVAGAMVEYCPLYANPHATTRLAGGWAPRSEAFTGPDGSYTLTVLPGQGLIGVTGPNPDAYMPGFVSLKQRKDFFKTPLYEFNGDGMVWAIGGNAFNPLPHYDSHALVLLEPGEKEEGLVKDVVLEPPQERKGRVVGPDGQPIAGVTVSGLWPRWYVTETLKGPEFTVHGLNPRANRGLTFHHKEKNLGFYLKALPDEKSGPLTVKLQPCGSASGRIVDQDGQPIAGERLPGIGGSAELITDKEGRFHVEGLVPGVEYRLMRPRVAATLLVSVVVEPGKNKDLGDLKLDR